MYNKWEWLYTYGGRKEGGRMKKYKLIDAYDFEDEVIGYADTLEEVEDLINARNLDTDGECYLITSEWNPDSRRYSIIRY